jgi:hypothetical protein
MLAPRPSGGVAHAMAVFVAVSVRDGKQGGEKRLVVARRLRAIASTFSRTNWFCISWKCGSTNEAFHVRFATQMFTGNVLEIVSHVTSIWHPSRLPRV